MTISRKISQFLATNSNEFYYIILWVQYGKKQHEITKQHQSDAIEQSITVEYTGLQKQCVVYTCIDAHGVHVYCEVFVVVFSFIYVCRYTVLDLSLGGW